MVLPKIVLSAVAAASSPATELPTFIMSVDDLGRALCAGPNADQRLMILDHRNLHKGELDLDFDYLLDSYRDRPIILKYSGVPTQAKNAIQAAVNIWASKLLITTTFTLKFYWENLDEDDDWLAYAVASYDEDEEEVSFWCLDSLDDGCVPTTLANQIAGRRLMGTGDSDPDFEIHINKGEDWYYGLDGNPGDDEFDLVTVVLHELGHAFGFYDSFTIDHDEETAEFFDSGDLFYVYDRYIWTWKDEEVMDLENDSEEIYEALTGEKLLWGGWREMKNTRGESMRSVRENGGPIMLWASSDPEKGGRVAHLDADAFPELNREGLMSPYQSMGSAKHNIGPVTLGMLYDMGWELKEQSLELADILRCLEGR